MTQLDLLALLDEHTADDRQRALYDASGLVFDTDRCRAGTHHACTGIVHVRSGDMLHSHVSSSSGPCRCSCHA